MVGTWTFDATNRIITCVGGTSGSPAGFVDAWNADKAGSRTLLTAIASPFTASLATNVRPCEDLALPISIVVTNFSEAGTVTLTGRDAWGNAISEVINIAGNGTSVSTLRYASIDANGVVAEGTFSVAITQPRWGVVWKQGTGQYQLDCRLYLGNGSTQTYFWDMDKEILFTPTAVTGDYQTIIYGYANSTFQLGQIDNAAQKATSRGCTILAQDDYISGFISVPTLKLYNSRLHRPTTGYFSRRASVFGYTMHLYDCTIIGAELPYQNGIISWDINRCTFVKGLAFIEFWSAGGSPSISINDVTCETIGQNTFQLLTNVGNLTIVALRVKNTNLMCLGDHGTQGNLYLVNADSPTWNCSFRPDSLAIIHRQYSFDLKTTHCATVLLKDVAGATVYSGTADENGLIPTQYVTYQTFASDGAWGTTVVTKSPHTLTISKDGKMTHTQTGIIFSEKTKLQINLRDQLTGTANAADVAKDKNFYKDDADTKITGTYENPGILIDVGSGRPVLNLNRKKLDNQLILGL